MKKKNEFLLDKTDLAFIAFLAIFSIIFISAISNIEFIGIGDSPIYANVAQHLVEQGAFESDYVMTFFTQYDTIPHFEDNWSVLPSVTIAISYLVLGVSLFAAQMTNYWVVMLIFISLYFIGSKFFNKKIALVASLLYISNILVWDNILVPMSEAVFGLTVLVFALSLFSYKKTSDKKWLYLAFASAFILGTARSSALSFVPIAFIWGLYLYRDSLRFEFLKKWKWLEQKIGKWKNPSKDQPKNKTLITVFALLSMIVFLGFAVQPIFVFLEFDSFTHQPAKNAVIRIDKADEQSTYNDIFRIYYGEEYRSEIITQENGFTVFKGAALDYGRFLRDLLTQNVFSTFILIFFVLGLFSNKFWTREIARLTLIGLLIFSLMVIFLGHYEQRYTIIFAPLISLVAGAAIFEQFGNMKKFFDKTLFVSIISLFLIITFLATYSLVVLPDRFFASEDGRIETTLESLTWIEENTPKDSIIFSRVVATVGYHSNRQAIMLPNNEWDDILLVADYYNADYFWFANWDFGRDNPRFDGIYKGEFPEFLELVYDSHPDEGEGVRERVRIFKINWEKANFESIEKPDWFFR